MLVLNKSAIDEFWLAATIDRKEHRIIEKFAYATGTKSKNLTAEEALIQSVIQSSPNANAVVVTLRTGDERLTGRALQIEGLAAHDEKVA